MSLDTVGDPERSREKLLGAREIERSDLPHSSIGLAMSPKKTVVADFSKDVGYEMMATPDPSKCYWLGCYKPPREGSKYCSDECGMNLAKFRILQLLPDKVKALKETPCVADMKNKQELERLNQQIIEIKMLVEGLEEDRKILDKFIEEVQQIPYQAELEPVNMKGHDDNYTMMSCLLCGHDVCLKNYVIHLERCFSKIESYVIAEGTVSTTLPGTKILCEHFDPRKRTYCRRLDALCPDHNRNKGWNKRTGESVICGSPQSCGPHSKLELKLELKEVCRAARTKCKQHYNWENLRRAEIDMQKWDAFVKLDILIRKEQQIHQAMTERRSVLGLLLHTTTPEETVPR